MEKYQEDNPSNARVFIDFRKEKDDKVRFEYVGKEPKSPVLTIFKLLQIHWIVGIVSAYIFCFFYILTLIYPKGSYIPTIIASTISLGTYTLTWIWAFIISKVPYLLKIVPKANALKLRKCHLKYVYPDEIKENKFELPLFKNVLLDYICFSDFGDKLEKVEILEHDFFINGTSKPTQYLWKAVFYFKDKPINGHMELRFQ